MTKRPLTERSIATALLVLLAISALVRAFTAGFIEFTNDEVYYRLYAAYPAWSHFDHPPMVGWVIQLFTCNLLLDTTFFIRLGAVVLGTFNTWLVYRIGKEIRSPLTGLYAALLYTASLYNFIISGTFIMPDTPQTTFWLLALWMFLKALPDTELTPGSRRNLLLAGVALGLALLSKYHSVFLAGGAILYILLYNRRWLRAKEAWLAFLIAFVLFLPVVIWNRQNDFISFTYHQTRINAGNRLINWNFFLTETAGQFFYNNPVNVVLILLALIALFRRPLFLQRPHIRILVLVSAPLSLTILVISLFRVTLPHWTGPAFLGFILIAAAWLADTRLNRRLVPWPLRVSLGLLLLMMAAGIAQIRYGLIPLEKFGTEDPTRLMSGWKDLGAAFTRISEKDNADARMSADAPLLATRWFPAANYDFYLGKPTGRFAYPLGNLERIHKYYWINKSRGNLHAGTDAYFLSEKTDFTDPREIYGELFDSVVPGDSIRIERCGKLLREVYLFRLYHLKREISFTRLEDFTEPSEKLVESFYTAMRSNPTWYWNLQKTARYRGRPLEEVMWEEARYSAGIYLRSNPENKDQAPPQ